MGKAETATATKTLNDILNEYHELECIMIENGGVIDDEIIGKLEKNAEELGLKLNGYAGYIDYLKGQVGYLKSQEQLFAQRRKTTENAIESLRQRMVFAIQSTGQEKVKTTTRSYSIRTTESWKMRNDVSKEMEDELVADGFGVYEFKPDMTAIKDEYKGSEPPEFIEVSKKTSITIR